MRPTAVTKNSSRLLLLVLACFVVAVTIVGVASKAAAQSSTVAATICAPTSMVTLVHPVSDSVVTSTTVPIDGTVNQASQIEIRIDGVFDSVIPLAIGQTTFSGSVQIASGTHTIEATALNVCAGPNGTASAVVTYTPPPQTPSTGTGTPTTVEGVSPVGSDGDAHQSTGGLSLLDQMIRPIREFAAWLNIDTGSQIENVSSLSIGKAITMTIGMYLLVVGLAPTFLQWISSLPIFVHAFPAISSSGRMRRIGRIARVIGILLILIALFL